VAKVEDKADSEECKEEGPEEPIRLEGWVDSAVATVVAAWVATPVAAIETTEAIANARQAVR